MDLVLVHHALQREGEVLEHQVDLEESATQLAVLRGERLQQVHDVLLRVLDPVVELPHQLLELRAVTQVDLLQEQLLGR